LAEKYRYRVVNDDLEQTVRDIIEILKKEAKEASRPETS